jgi:redox-sensitive bicupin YhaK (pirin superfamily)
MPETTEAPSPLQPPALLVIEGRPADLGHGLLVRRLLPSAKRRMVGPFVFLDHAGPVRMPAASAHEADVRPHPHIGLSTVSYLLSGAIVHRDSLGTEQVIRPGDVNWMTAGRGISHSERFEDPAVSEGAGLELLQCWVALPEADEETEPAFVHHPATDLPVVEHDGTWMRIVAGEAFGARSPVQTHSPLFFIHAVLRAGAPLPLPAGPTERAAYVVSGGIQAGEELHGTGRLLVFAPGVVPAPVARADSTVILFGGEPVGPRHLWWNFVSSSRERIEQAKADWQAGRIPLPPHDHDEFIPLPSPRA